MKSTAPGKHDGVDLTPVARDQARQVSGSVAPLAAILSGVFLVGTGVLKLATPAPLPDVAENAILLVASVWRLSPLIAGLEVVVGVFLLVPGLRSYGVPCGTVFATSSAAYLGWMILVGVDPAKCGCFGSVRVTTGWHLAINGLLLTLMGVLVLASSKVEGHKA